MATYPALGQKPYRDDLLAWMEQQYGALNFSLTAALSAGATTMTLAQTPPSGFASRASLIAIGPGTSCEIRRINAMTGSQLTFDGALANAHPITDPVIWLANGAINPACFGAVGNVAGGPEVDDTAALQAAISETRALGIWLDGCMARYITNETLVFPQDARLRNFIKIKAGVACTFTGANDWMGISCQNSPQSFTVNTGTNVFTTPLGHGIGTTTTMIIFKGAALPAPLVSGRIYYVASIPTSTTFTVSATSGGATLDITTSGSGVMTMYPEVGSLERVYFDDVYWDGALLAQNGFLGSFQQPCMWRKVRVDNCNGTGVFLTGQQYDVHNLEIIRCGTGLVVGGVEPYIYGFNAEACTVKGVSVYGAYGGIWGAHLENNPIHVHIPSDADVRSFMIDYPIFHSSTTADVKVDTLSSDYEIRGLIHYGGSGTDVVIQDTARGYTLTKDEIGQGSVNYEPSFAQQRGGLAPLTRTRRMRTVTTTYTAKVSDGLILANATSGAFTITLPPVANMEGLQLTIKRTSSAANNVTIDGNASELIDGAATYVLTAQYQSVTLLVAGATWQVV